MKVCALIMAGGSGRRMGGGTKKQYLKIGGREILRVTAEVFESSPLIDEIIIVAGSDDADNVKRLLCGMDKIKKVVCGGSERQYSVHNGLKAAEGCDIVLIHDGVRPFVTEGEIAACIDEAKKGGACVLGVPVKDTIKFCDENGIVKVTPERSLLWAAQTPQCFKYELIRRAYDEAARDGFLGTDDASLAERIGIDVKMVAGSYKNIKITTPEDLVTAEAIIRG